MFWKNRSIKKLCIIFNNTSNVSGTVLDWNQMFRFEYTQNPHKEGNIFQHLAEILGVIINLSSCFVICNNKFSSWYEGMALNWRDWFCDLSATTLEFYCLPLKIWVKYKYMFFTVSPLISKINFVNLDHFWEFNQLLITNLSYLWHTEFHFPLKR